MFTLVIGGAASGKSGYAEGLVLASPHRPRYYIATMEPLDGEARRRVEKHRGMRADKRFETVECYTKYSAIPLPRPEWNGKNMRYAMCAFPLIGLVCGALWWGWGTACVWLDAPSLLRGAGLCLIPAAVTGGIHLDGFADTCDARASCAPPEKRQEILKDPRCGAFAAIRLCGYFAAHLALCAALRPTGEALWCMGLAFVLERGLSGLAITRFPLAKNTGLAHTFATAADRRTAGRVLMLECALAGGGTIALGGVAGIVMLAAALVAFWRCRVVADREFGGLSGDLAGWFLQRAELWMLAALVICQMLEAKLL